MTLWLEIEGKQHRVELSDALLASAQGRGQRHAQSHAEGSGSARPEDVRCTVDGVTTSIDARIIECGVLSLIVVAGDGSRRQFRCVLDGDSVLVAGRRFACTESDPRSLQARAGAGGAGGGAKPVKAPMPGRVVRVLVAVGDEVAEGQGLVVIEAMKMQNELRSPKAGRVARVAVAVGDTVASGLVMVVVE